MTEFDGDFRAVVAKAFQASGGVNALTKWIKKNVANQSQFYTQMVAKLVALPPVQQVNVAIDNSNAELDRAKLTQIFENHIRVQREDEAERAAAAGIILDGKITKMHLNGLSLDAMAVNMPGSQLHIGRPLDRVPRGDRTSISALYHGQQGQLARVSLLSPYYDVRLHSRSRGRFVCFVPGVAVQSLPSS